ncbi:SDR family NAD(P)-dependent oxidoreductase [Aeromicrobium duanguangcaii]|uniref:SDR family NAD(P)-dependent oxidoreductase n=1 Tax=Aeromicrobium duanguangcaii TaxID=2968086 RepID=A0ABY5KE94_9ACTN|nr:SDR family NAD(P)-dependent oxidoreductase [Aeromicrobium duanguangcaii]MCD9154836.1 SDR family NAD(P)-dependent oxidoreductase [Aeromicrobium duanguangcaii]MCL3838964.1 SDR family NAD(P)-dependent oxidoreductase [Aeromicrobium duanguangcaii]UUI67751.1 SDR family NAD(P)-dependent oxidoreductase [Aeromicrobium duanguangcaii]
MTNSVAVVTGGSGGVGLAMAKLLARDHHVVLSDSSGERLHRALDELDSSGVSAESIVADVTDRRSVETLLRAAREAGPIASVVHAPSGVARRACPESIVRSRVLGTIHITAATLAVAGFGTTLIHASGHAAPPAPLTSVPRWIFRLAPTDPEGVATALTRLADLGPARWGPGTAHALSGTFVDWYTARMAEVYDACGARLRSVTAEAVLELCRDGLGRPAPVLGEPAA